MVFVKVLLFATAIFSARSNFSISSVFDCISSINCCFDFDVPLASRLDLHLFWSSWQPASNLLTFAFCTSSSALCFYCILLSLIVFLKVRASYYLMLLLSWVCSPDTYVRCPSMTFCNWTTLSLRFCIVCSWSKFIQDFNWWSSSTSRSNEPSFLRFPILTEGSDANYLYLS